MTELIDEEVARAGRIAVADSILEVVCRTTGMGFAAIARVTEDRWIACAVRDEIAFGLKPGGELEVASTICDEIRQSGEAVVIDHVAEDKAFCGHHTPAQYGFQSYISVPIFREGKFFGTLCAIDPRPARLKTPEVIGMFTLFADLIARHIEAEDRLAASEAALLSAREAGELREQFIAVLGHDLRNPLAAIQGAGRLIVRSGVNERAETLVGMMNSSVKRMSGLIDNVLDFARARLGGGLGLEHRNVTDLSSALHQVVDELRIVHPEHEIEARIELSEPVDCDSGRIERLLSNLLANALVHGDPAGRVELGAETRDGDFVMWVANSGPPIVGEIAERLFEPFSRAKVRPSAQGLGLGLYIAAQIARAHQGELTVASDESQTLFTFRMPLVAP